MSYIVGISQNTLTIDVVRVPKIYIPAIKKIVARHEFGMVVLFVDNRRVEFDTTTSVKIGLAIARAIPKLEFDEMILMKINDEPIELLKPFASRVATALLRKADDADDWQLKNRRVLQ